jgi:hypothetical protein
MAGDARSRGTAAPGGVVVGFAVALAVAVVLIAVCTWALVARALPTSKTPCAVPGAARGVQRVLSRGRVVPRGRVPASALPAPVSGRTTLSSAPVLDVLHDFMTAAEAAHIIELAKGRFKRSPVIDSKTGAQGTDPDRTSHTVFLEHAETPIVAAIEARAAAVAGVPVRYLERTQVVRYEPGQFYRPHHDYIKGRPEEVASKGQRTVTIFAYLNDLPADQEPGGGTHFPQLGQTVRPVRGAAALWHNTTPDGVIDPRTLHGGDPVHNLTKYGMNLWFRELPVW